MSSGNHYKMTSDAVDLADAYTRLKAIKATLELDTSGNIVPNPRQMRYINSDADENMLCGLNQGGKSFSLKLVANYHITGLYPEWYTGRKFEHPVNAMLGGETAETTRDLLTDDLLGDSTSRGSGIIPASCIEPNKIIIKKQGERGQVDYFRVKHHTNGVFDGWSWVKCFAYSKGWAKMQGYTIHLILIDEEPPFPVYDELSARTNKTGGLIYITMTPLSGYTELYQLFRNDHTGHRRIITYGVDHATHLTDVEVKRLKNKYAGHYMRMTRLYGEPTVGKGLVYPGLSEELKMDPVPVPVHWKQIIGLDFPHTSGSFAAAKLAFNPESGEVWLIADYKQKAQPSTHYADAVKRMGGDDLVCAWPHDAARMGAGGKTIKRLYSEHGLNMLPEYSHMLESYGGKSRKTNSVEIVIQKVFDLMASGLFKVFTTCEGFIKEVRTYRSENGKIVSHQDDHIIDALHKAIMMIRFAQEPGESFGSSTEYATGLDYEFFDA